MKKKTIWKSFDLYTLEEDKEFIDFLKEEYADEELSEEELRDKAYALIDEYFYDDFGKNGNVSYSSLKDTKCVVNGSLGLWYGRRDIEPKKFDSIESAVYACMSDCDSGEIYEDRYGNLRVDAYHHDGHNKFIIKKVTSKGLRTIHFCKNV